MNIIPCSCCVKSDKEIEFALTNRGTIKTTAIAPCVDKENCLAWQGYWHADINSTTACENDYIKNNLER